MNHIVVEPAVGRNRLLCQCCDKRPLKSLKPQVFGADAGISERIMKDSLDKPALPDLVEGLVLFNK